MKQNQFSLIKAHIHGELNDQETIKLFQSLIDSGLIWTLHGYIRQAKILIKMGYCHKAEV